MSGKLYNNVYYKLGLAEGKAERYKEALVAIRDIVQGDYESLDPQAKLEIEKIVMGALKNG